ncbi:MAG: HrpE/YscL family type III secretion apparatus protein [Succinatimonas sp.]|nr:HrpE/YscL family type III secretion apparatus protein [Succinatimonas sp.]
MSGTFVLKNAWQPQAGTRIVKASDYASLCKANELLIKVEQSLKDAQDKSLKLYDESYAKGLEEGRDEGKGEYIEKIMDMVLSSVESIEALESQLVEVVNNAVNKIIGDFDEKERIVRIVHQALNSVRGSKAITMRVCAEDERILRQELSGFIFSSDRSKGYINLVADPNLKAGDCILETEQGVVDASLDSQLKILNKVLQEHIVRKN